jgi:hypothetical protein
MAIIHYGKSVFIGNARTRRHRRRQPLSSLTQSIDEALNFPTETHPETCRANLPASGRPAR